MRPHDNDENDRTLERELRDHIDLEIEARVAEGDAPGEARRAARRLVGNVALVKEDVRAASRWGWWERLGQDVRYGLRTFRRTPVFTATAVLSLAVGIGANTAMFTIVHATYGKSLPVADPASLALVTTEDNFSYPSYRTLAGASRSFTDLVAASAAIPTAVDVGGGAEPADVKIVSANYFRGLGVPASAGRVFGPAEDAEPLAVVSHAFWRARLGASPDVAGRLVRISGRPVTVVGVAPQNFHGETTGELPDAWTTVALQPEEMRNERGFTWLRLLGRLRPGVSLEQAAAELKALEPDLDIGVAAGARGTAGLRERFAAPLTVMFVMVGIVLLIACTNLAGLLLTRGTARRDEIAIRLALGSSRARIVRQLMTENLLMASMGSALGLLLSLWGTRLVVGLVAGTGQRLALRLQPDLVVLLFTAGAAVVTGLIFGLAPALRATKSAALASLVERGRTVIAAGRRWSARDSFIAVQIGLSLVLVACGTMFVRTVRNLEMQDIGSRPERLLLASIVPDRGHRPELSVLVPRLVERVRALPGVESASVAAFGTLANQGGIYGIEVDGFTPTDQQDTRARVDYVGPDYLRTAGIPLVAGREFAWTDAGDSMPVAVVNETMARFYFGDVRAVGRRFRFNKTEFAIVGVARDAKYSELRETAPPRYVYFSALQRAPGVRSLEIRVSSGAAPTLAALRALVRDVDPRLMIPAVMPMSERISLKGGVERMVAALVAFFAVVTLLLAAIGIYGTIAYNAARRTKEIGLRLALGASRAGVIWLLIGAVGVQLAVGVVAGVAAVALGGRLVASLLFGVGPTDPLTIGMPVALLAAVALVAGSIPALRAARLDPARVLRE